MTLYGAPSTVAFCVHCVATNQRPSSTVERRNVGQPKTTLGFNDRGECAACEYQRHIDGLIDWQERDAELRALCDRYRSKDGSPDCIVPGSGGKDSWFAACRLAEDYGMHPLTVTWAPMLITHVGARNYLRWSRLFNHRRMARHEPTHRYLTRLAFDNLPYPFQPFVIGQRHCGARVSVETGIPLVFYGENPAQYAGPVLQNYEPRMEPEYYSDDDASEEAVNIGGVSGAELMSTHGVQRRHLEPYTPTTTAAVKAAGTEFHYLGYYLRWDPQSVYYYAQERGFECGDRRTFGTYSKYSSIDDKIDTLHYRTTLMMFGIGRATYDAAQEVRWGKIDRDEAVALVRRFDNEDPMKNPEAFHLTDICDYLRLSPKQLTERLDAARAPHLWEHGEGGWKLRQPIC